MGKDSPLGIQIINSNAPLLGPKHTFLTLFLLQEKLLKVESVWFNYLNILPNNFSNFPVFYSGSEVKYLKGSPMIGIITILI
jgi:histone-lysine N-methyltransferase SETD3